MKVTIFYLNNRMVGKNEIPKNAVLKNTKKAKDKWGKHDVFEKYYELNK